MGYIVGGSILIFKKRMEKCTGGTHTSFRVAGTLGIGAEKGGMGSWAFGWPVKVDFF